MFVPAAARSQLGNLLKPRQQPPGGQPDSGQSVRSPTAYIILISIIAGIIGIGVLAVLVRSIRARFPNPKYIPTQYLKNRWTNWKVARGYESANGDDSSYDPGRSMQDGRRGGYSAANARNRRGGINRNTSVRSVLTLPAYMEEPGTDERVLGREGERDGIDVVLEHRTAEEEETLRDAEMEQLYRIRLLRREWNARREERRLERLDARARGDVAVLERLRDEARLARDNNELDELRRELDDIKSERGAHISVVSYADVGVARADGTRVRDNSMESEQVGLLSDAESMANGSTRNRTSSLMTFSTGHSRARSNSAVSMETDMASPDIAQPLANSRAESRVSHERPSARVAEVDLGDERLSHNPPSYDDVETERSSQNTPSSYPQQPPGYMSRGPSLSHGHHSRTGLGISDNEQDETQAGADGIPRLPSLRLTRLPQIVVEPRQ